MASEIEAPQAKEGLWALPDQNSKKRLTYRPLRGKEVRVLGIHPYKESIGLLECSLHYIDIGSGKYGALSYAWGDPTARETILVDGEPFHVTINLAAFLKMLNKKRYWLEMPQDSMMYIWVDAVCINQEDVSERNRQVLRMGDIYSGASVVLVWLGPPMEHTQLAYNRIVDINTEVAKLKGSGLTGAALFSPLSDIARRMIGDDIPDDMDVAVERATREGLKDLLSRSWWSRCWILQEAWAHDHPTFFCGDFAIEKYQFVTHLLILSVNALSFGKDAITHMANPEFMAASLALDTKRKVAHKKDSMLLALLQRCRANEATDPKDKIYGILGLSWDFDSGPEIIPDYNLPVQEVYIGVAKATIEKHRNLDIFGSCGYSVGGLDLPSWVPDWTAAPETATGLPFEKHDDGPDDKIYNVYHASDNSLLVGKYSPVVINRELHIYGFHLDVVSILYQTVDYTDSNLNDIEKDWMPEKPEAPYMSTAETMKEAYLRTIVADFHVMFVEGSGRGYSMVWPEFQPDTGESENHDQSNKVKFAQYELMRACHKRCFAYTRRGWMGLLPRGARVGDSLAILIGGQVLYVLRRSIGAGEATFELVGEAYVHGMMDGAAMKLVESGERTIEKIVLR